MNGKWIKTLEIICTAVGLGLNVASNVLGQKKQEIQIKNAAAEAVAKHFNKN